MTSARTKKNARPRSTWPVTGKDADRGPVHVYLSRPQAEAEEEFLAHVALSRRLHHPWLQAPDDSVAFASYLERCAKPKYASFWVRRSDDDALVGVFNISEIVRGPFRSAYLSYYAFAPLAGRGYMTAGMRLILHQAFIKLRLHRLEANLQPGNHPSRALCQRCGFTQEGYSPRYLKIAGRWRDHERWALLIEDWRKLHAR